MPFFLKKFARRYVTLLLKLHLLMPYLIVKVFKNPSPYIILSWNPNFIKMIIFDHSPIPHINVFNFSEKEFLKQMLCGNFNLREINKFMTGSLNLLLSFSLMTVLLNMALTSCKLVNISTEWGESNNFFKKWR